MPDTVGTRLFSATTDFLRSQPMLMDDEIKAMYTLKEFLDRVYRYHRRRGSLSGSGRQYFTGSNFRPVTRASSGSYTSRRSVGGLVASHAETESGLATAAIKGILCAVQPFQELSEYDVSTSVFEKLFGQTIAFYWSLHKPTATRIALATTAWCLVYYSPFQALLLHYINVTLGRLVSMFCVLWLVLYFWSQLNWRMTVTVLGYFDSWFFITQAICYAMAIMALNDFDPLVIVYNIFGILGFSAVIAYDAYPLSMRSLAKYMLFIIMICLIGTMVSMGLNAGAMDKSLHLDMVHGLVHANCTLVENVAFTWNFNVFDFAIQRLQILAIYMVRNTYWAFNAPRYCVIIKSRVALEEVPVIGVRVISKQPSSSVAHGRRHTLVRGSFLEPGAPPNGTLSYATGGGSGSSSGSSSVAPVTLASTTSFKANTGPLYDLHPIQIDAAHVYDGRHRMSIVSLSKDTSSMLDSDAGSSLALNTDSAMTPDVKTKAQTPKLGAHRPPKPSRYNIKLPHLASFHRGDSIGDANRPTNSFKMGSHRFIKTSFRTIPVKRKSSSVPRNLTQLIAGGGAIIENGGATAVVPATAVVSATAVVPATDNLVMRYTGSG
ncbi:Aste57867_13528 [Aphanomyces stellatus]|uniref:Aste57867_13528 protein n=1 Tax=Aphanomyces stellatus TaxID=120398 RepID=A0A485KYP7_9STRA|nr:hypothetical protein As57867_013478 [Aphanomyces stellatus]VFT90366.1 Aste57867_13528 [Aphanomyces stellatus]